jgi:aspartyl-tRNA(Asn)/glutamyl-tRNA(Gln) amidotransferase subunit A
MATILEFARELAAGRTSSVAIAEKALSRAQAPAGEGARIFIKLDPAKVLAQARASDELRKAGIVPSPLAGLPVTVKDLFDVAGEVTAAGSAVLAGAPPAASDAPVIARLRAAGAVLFGRTNMTEFAYSGLGLNPHYGTPSSPYDRATGRIPGGSSSGGAVSVADGIGVIGLGTDTGGSTRIPAAFCGVVGYKPTAARIPIDGVFPLAMTLDSVGPMGASVACCAIADAILAGAAPQVPPAAALAGLRLGIPQTLVLDDLEPAVAAAFQAVTKLLSSAGAHIVDIPVKPFGEIIEINRRVGLSPMEANYIHRDLLAHSGAGYDPRVRFRIQAGEKASAADYLAMLATRRDWMARVRAEIEPYDAILLPTVACLAPAIKPLLTDEDLYRRANMLVLRNTSLINFLDGCSLSIPCQAPGAAPVGLMIAGNAGSDRRIFAIGLAIEAALARRS